jgi:hypothetical protein
VVGGMAIKVVCFVMAESPLEFLQRKPDSNFNKGLKAARKTCEGELLFWKQMYPP